MSIPHSRRDIERELCQVVAEKLQRDPDKIRMDDDVVVDLGADSLAMAELTVQLEQRMGVRVPGEDWLEVSTVGELADLIERYQHA
jgi:acyl carrier protein